MRTFKGLHTVNLTILALVAAAGAAWGQTAVRPGFNLFTVDQDSEIGKQSAVEVERQIPMLSDPIVSEYIADLGTKLAARAPGPKYAYQFKVANLSDINAFALPGGFIYIHRGLIEKVRSEGELAGVMSHEIAHVALRHATNQASKAYLAQAGLGILGGLLGGKTESTTGQIIGAVGGFGLNALFLKYSRGAETQADIVGAQTMAKAGYDPMEMVRFFETLRQQAGSDPGTVAQFLSDHPAPVDREERVRQEAKLLGPVRPSPPVGSIAALQRELGRLSPAPAMAELASTQTPTAPERPQSTAGSAGISVEPPSTRFRTFRQRQAFFELQYPDNWSAYEPSQGYGVTIAPNSGFVTTSDGRQTLACGVVVNHYIPFDGAVGARYRDPLGSLFGGTPLEEATSDLARQVMNANPHLKLVAGSERHRRRSGSFSVMLSGLSPVTGVEEQVTVLTRQLPDNHVVYILLVTPAKDYTMLAPSFDRVVRSLKVNVRAVHQ